MRLCQVLTCLNNFILSWFQVCFSPLIIGYHSSSFPCYNIVIANLNLRVTRAAMFPLFCSCNGVAAPLRNMLPRRMRTSRCPILVRRKTQPSSSPLSWWLIWAPLTPSFYCSSSARAWLQVERLRVDQANSNQLFFLKWSPDVVQLIKNHACLQACWITLQGCIVTAEMAEKTRGSHT